MHGLRDPLPYEVPISPPACTRGFIIPLAPVEPPVPGTKGHRVSAGQNSALPCSEGSGDRKSHFKTKEAVSSAVAVPCFATKRKVKLPGSSGARGTVAKNGMRPSLSGSPSCTGPPPRT